MDCVPIAEDIRRVRRPDAYKLKARRGGVEAAASLLEEFGTELSEWTEEQADMLAGVMWDGCSRRLRELVRNNDAPF